LHWLGSWGDETWFKNHVCCFKLYINPWHFVRLPVGSIIVFVGFWYIIFIIDLLPISPFVLETAFFIVLCMVFLKEDDSPAYIFLFYYLEWFAIKLYRSLSLST
jgi:hypothetical protein